MSESKRKTVVMVTLATKDYRMYLAFSALPTWWQLIHSLNQLYINDRVYAIRKAVDEAWKGCWGKQSLMHAEYPSGLSVSLQVIDHFTLEDSDGQTNS